MPRRHRAALAALPVAGLVLAACSTGGGGSGASATGADFSGTPSGTLTGWAFDNADDVGKARMQYAADQLKGVTIKLDQTAFDAQKLTTRLAGGNVPDVIQMDRGFVTTYAAQGVIMPLDKCFSEHDVEPDSLWYPFVVDDVRYQGHVWAVPQFYQPPAILLNERVMQAAGVTDDQIDTSKPEVLLAAIAKMTKLSGDKPTTIGFDPVATGQPQLWVLGMGGKLTDADGKPTLDDPANQAGIDLLKKITDAEGGFARVKSFTDAFDTFGDKNQFVEDQVGAQVNAQWYPNVLAPYMDQVQLSAVPFRGKDGKPFSVASGTAFVIPTAAKNPAAACAWALDLTALDAWKAAEAARVATLKSSNGINTGLFTGSPAADKEIRSANVVKTGDAGFDQVVATYYDVLDYGKTFGSSPAGQAIQSELTNAVTAALLGQKSSEKALADAQSAAMRAYESATQNGG